MINYGELSQIFGVNSFDEVVENDPFADRTTQTTSTTTETNANAVLTEATTTTN